MRCFLPLSAGSWKLEVYVIRTFCIYCICLERRTAKGTSFCCSNTSTNSNLCRDFIGNIFFIAREQALRPGFVIKGSKRKSCNLNYPNEKSIIMFCFMSECVFGMFNRWKSFSFRRRNFFPFVFVAKEIHSERSQTSPPARAAPSPMINS